MKYTAFLVALLFGVKCVAQNVSYTDWEKKAQTDINLRPEYGNVKKTKEQIAIDDEFIKTELSIDTNRTKASEHLVNLGFTYLYRGDTETAMKRFNQAWLLNKKNENAYWGFAAVYFNFNDLIEAKKQLDKGLAINPNSSNILTDEATIHMSRYAVNRNKEELNTAITIFKKSYSIAPKNQNTLFKLSAAYYYSNDCVNALKYYNECMKLGGQQITPGYGEALKKMCNM
ncbi:MAG TPA: tetratricopeptide repeat protein [Mucilaginibacter sp.]|nr:tetratricopeptide repeat protein [Mucilaginibacter sp.]